MISTKLDIRVGTILEMSESAESRQAAAVQD